MTAWHTLHVAYHDDLDRLVGDGVRPLFREVGGRVAAAYWTRHWRRGPHLRVNVRTDAGTFATVVRPAVDDTIGCFLAAHPSRRVLDPDALLPLHRRLAALEQESGDLLPWYPDNSVQVAAYDDRAAVLGAEAAALLSDFYIDTTDLAFAATGRPATGLGFDLMVATAYALSGMELTAAFVSFRSHAEAFLTGFPEGPALRAGWEAKARRHGAALAARVGAVVDTLDGRSDAVPHVREWVAVLRPHRLRAERMIAFGGLLPTGGTDRAAPTSDFHRVLLADPQWAELESADWFLLYRVMLNYTYLHLTRLGVTPVERFLLCHLAAAAVERRYGVDAAEVIRQPAVGPAA